MTKVKACQIEQASTYPCPCSKLGELCPIVLTDAFGCSHCQQIFVIREDGYALEQISSIYPYRQHWYWTGQVWRLVRPPLFKSKLARFLGGLTLLVVMILCISLLLRIPLVTSLVVLMLLPLLVILMAWLIIYRRT